MIDFNHYKMPTMRTIVNAQYAMTHAAYHYWKGYMEGFMDEYRESVKEFNADYSQYEAAQQTQTFNDPPKKKAKAKKHG